MAREYPDHGTELQGAHESIGAVIEWLKEPLDYQTIEQSRDWALPQLERARELVGNVLSDSDGEADQL